MPEDSRPATKQDLNELRDQLVEQMRDMQTEVLRAFHDWAQPVEIKLRAIPPLDERLGCSKSASAGSNVAKSGTDCQRPILGGAPGSPLHLPTRRRVRFITRNGVGPAVYRRHPPHAGPRSRI
jgi:hypothetical protein